MTDLIEDVSKLTEISESTLRKLLNTVNYICGHSVYESLCTHDSITTIDLGIGHLQIKIDSNNIYYKFIPSKELEKTLIQTVKTGSSPILLKLDTKIQEKIERTYKELL